MKIASFLILWVTFASCSEISKRIDGLNNEKIELKPVSINKEFSLGIPSYMKETTTLNDNASLQYQNVFKELYVIVIEDVKQDFIDTFIKYDEYDSTKSVVENYRIVQIKMISENLKVNTQTNPVKLKINKLNAQRLQMDCEIEDYNGEISYFFTFIEGREKMYMIMSWTLKDRKAKSAKLFDAIAKSFRLI